MSSEGIDSRSVGTTHIADKAASGSEIKAELPTGKAFQRSVQIKGSDPRAALPRSRGLSGVPLGERKTKNIYLTKEGFFPRLKSWLFKKPTETDQFAVRTVFRNLQQAYEGATSRPGDSESLHINNGIVTKAGSPGHRVSALLVEVGLARFVTPKEGGDVQIEFLRPKDLQAQVRLAELLFESVPLELSGDNKLDWTAMMAKMQPQILNNLLMAGALKNSGSGWSLAKWNSKIDDSLKQYSASEAKSDLGKGMEYWSGRLQLLARELAEDSEDDSEDDSEKDSLLKLGSLINDYPNRHTEIDEKLTRAGKTQSLHQELQQCRDELTVLLKLNGSD